MSTGAKIRWSKEELAELIRLMNDGKTPREIAVILGREHEAVRTKGFQVRYDDFVIPNDRPTPMLRMRWYEAPADGLYKRAKAALGDRHKYHPKFGNFVDGRKVTVQEMIKISGVQND